MYSCIPFREGLFTVMQENVPCGESGVTCTRAISIFYLERRFHLLGGLVLTVDGEEVRPNSGRDIAPGVRFYAHSLNYILSFDVLGLVIRADGSKCDL